jgi:hypothetical protein
MYHACFQIDDLGQWSQSLCVCRREKAQDHPYWCAPPPLLPCAHQRVAEALGRRGTERCVRVVRIVVCWPALPLESLTPPYT